MKVFVLEIGRPSPYEDLSPSMSFGDRSMGREPIAEVRLIVSQETARTFAAWLYRDAEVHITEAGKS